MKQKQADRENKYRIDFLSTFLKEVQTMKKKTKGT